MSRPLPRRPRRPFSTVVLAVFVAGSATRTEAPLGDLPAWVIPGDFSGFGALALCGVALLALMLCWWRTAGRAGSERRTRDQLADAVREATRLLRMSARLQHCQNPAEVARAVLDMMPRLLPESSGNIVIFATETNGDPFRTHWGKDDNEHSTHSSCKALTGGQMQVSDMSGCCCVRIGEPALCVPIGGGSEIRGVLRIRGPLSPRSASVQRVGLAVADAASSVLASLAVRDALRGQAMRDPLTGLYNRRMLEEVAEGMTRQAVRRGATLAVALLDIDHFKRLNDRHGHAIGDSALRAIGALLRTRLCRSDVACRYGGEEFLLLMPDCDTVQARQRMDELRRLIAGGWPEAGPHVPRFTCSIGIAAMAEDGESVAQLVRRADQALYAAKKLGRNRVSVAAGPQQPALRFAGTEAA